MHETIEPAWAVAMEARLVARMRQLEKGQIGEGFSSVDGGIAGLRAEIAQFHRDITDRLDALEAVLRAHRLPPRGDAP